MFDEKDYQCSKEENDFFNSFAKEIENIIFKKYLEHELPHFESGAFFAAVLSLLVLNYLRRISIVAKIDINKVLNEFFDQLMLNAKNNIEYIDSSLQDKK